MEERRCQISWVPMVNAMNVKLSKKFVFDKNNNSSRFGFGG